MFPSSRLSKIYDWTLSTRRWARHVYNVGSINDSGISVKKCARCNGSSCGQRSKHGVCVLNRAVQDCRRRLNQSHFRPMAEVSFSSRQQTEGKETLLAGKVGAQTGKNPPWGVWIFSGTTQRINWAWWSLKCLMKPNLQTRNCQSRFRKQYVSTVYCKNAVKTLM